MFVIFMSVCVCNMCRVYLQYVHIHMYAVTYRSRNLRLSAIPILYHCDKCKHRKNETKERERVQQEREREDGLEGKKERGEQGESEETEGDPGREPQRKKGSCH